MTEKKVSIKNYGRNHYFLEKSLENTFIFEDLIS